MIPENEIIEGCNVLFNEQLFCVKWKQSKGAIIRPVHDIGFFETSYDTLDPIPITADFLQDLGFTKVTDSLFSYRSGDGKNYEVQLIDPQNIKLQLDGQPSSITNLNVHLLQKEMFTSSKECCSLKTVV